MAAAAISLLVQGDGFATIPVWAVFLFAFAPDHSIVGYFAGPRVGADAYNAAHNCVAPGAPAGGAVLLASPTGLLLAVIWAGHIDLDRTLGCGLKYETGFTETHLSTPAAATSEPTAPASTEVPE